MSSNESMNESFDYEDYDESTDEDINDFIDDNNYTFIDNEDNNSVEIIDFQSDFEPNNENQTEDQNNHHLDSNQVMNDSEEDVLRLQSEESVEMKPNVKSLNQSFCSTQENSDNCCIICTEMWTTSGVHQLVSLSCGHLFGRKCIEQWLDPKKTLNHRCPQCNKTAKRKDIRVLYARNLRALDTTERDGTLDLLERERSIRKKFQKESIDKEIKLKEVLKENERLKKEYIECQQKLQHLGSNSRITENAIKTKTIRALNRKVENFQYIKEIEISNNGCCRHLGYSSLFEVLAVSQPNSNTQLFPGFGVKKIFLNDFKTDNICIHSKTIRDLEMNAYDGTILTTSLDKTVKLTSLLSKASIMSYNLEAEAWSVTFNPTNKHEFYVGLNNGQILLFDTRMMSTHVDCLTSSDRSPVVSLNHIQFESSVGSINGILSTQFHKIGLYERNGSTDSLTGSNFSLIDIPFEGRFGSAHFEPKSGLVLLSCRPSSKHTNTTHYAMELKVSVGAENEHIIEPEVIGCFEGGKQQIKLTRSRIFAHPSNANSALICSGDEWSKGALIWDLSCPTPLQKLMSETPVLDMCLLHNFNTNSYFMSSLTENSVKFYKYIS